MISKHSRKAQDHRRKKVERFYREIDNAGFCVYCGEQATSWDHFLPVLVAASLYDLSKAFGALELIESCEQCNITAGHILNFTFQERFTKVKLRLIQRKEKIINPRLYWSLEDNPAKEQLAQIKLDVTALYPSNQNKHAKGQLKRLFQIW